jgi:protein-tyrosine kinase
MSRIHDALRKVEQRAATPLMGHQPLVPDASPASYAPVPEQSATTATAPGYLDQELLRQVVEIPFTPVFEAHLLGPNGAENAPGEEFRSLRTRLNHIQSLEGIHSIVVTSPSPAEGKSFTAANLALTQSHMANNTTLLADFDFRRPTIHGLFQFERSPGLTDYLLGKCALHEAMRKIQDTNLYVIPAGTPVKNPLELLNLQEVREMLEQLPALFNWIIMDTPPLLFSADANLLTTLVDGTVLVVRLGSTTIDSVTRAMQSLCENNVLGIVANGARAGELYSKYTYYYSRHEDAESSSDVGETETASETAEPRA